MIGVRIELFSRLLRRFEKPIYVFLQKVEGSAKDKDGEQGARLRVVRHTVPPAVQLKSLVERFLPLPTKEAVQSGKKGPKQDLSDFVRNVRKEVVALQRRRDAVSSLANGGRRVKSAKALDAEARDWKLELREAESGNGGEGYARVKITDEGEIEEAVVMTDEGKRDLGLERRIRSRQRAEGLGTVFG